MKKTFVACLAVVALIAIASSASAITCTIDTRPAATLLIPYFQATFNADGSIDGTSPTAVDTIVTIGNASDAPMIAHVSVWSDRSELVLDFNIGLTGFDIQSMRMSSILEGFLPQTGYTTASGLHDGCERNVGASIWPDVSAGGFLRVGNLTATAAGPIPSPANNNDNTLATMLYANGPFNSSFLFQVLDSLDVTPDSNTCGGGTDGVIQNPIHGYLTIDHVNYCTLANPNDPTYYTLDAIGMENNLWGDYIYTSASGISTTGYAAVAIEADPTLDDTSGSPTDANFLPPASGCADTAVLDCQGKRTFYRRYTTSIDAGGCSVANGPAFTAAGPINPLDCGFGGDQREPLGLKYAARWLDDAADGVTSFFDIWRGSAIPSTTSGGLADLLGDPVGKCNTTEPTPSLTFFDEDETTVPGGVCPSPCSPTLSKVPLETQRLNIAFFSHPTTTAGWVSMSFFNAGGPVNGNLDQAWVTYDFSGPAAFISAGAPAAQLDPSTCNPLLAVTVPVTPVVPTFPLLGVGP